MNDKPKMSGLFRRRELPIHTALASMPLLNVFAGIGEARAFSGLGDPTVPMLISCLFLAKGMEISGLGRRFAVSLLCRSRAARKPFTLLLALTVATTAISLVLQNTATTAIMIPTGATVLQALDLQKRGSSLSFSVSGLSYKYSA